MAEGGVWASNLKERFSAPDGFANEVSEIKGVLRIRRGWHLGKRFYFEPNFSLVLPWRSGADGSSRAFTSVLGLEMGVSLVSFLSWRVGPGVQSLFMTSSAETVLLNNGTATSTFFLPNRMTLSWLLTVDTGFTVSLGRGWSLNADLFVANLANHLRRRYHATMTLGYQL